MESNSKLALVVYLVLAFLIMLPLLRPGYYLALDMQAGPNSYTDVQFSDFYGDVPSSYGAYFPTRMVMAAISDIISPEATEKLQLFIILFLCGACAHFSLPEEHGNARYFAGLLYMLNPFVFVRFLAGHWSLLLSYAIWPLALLSFSQFLEKPGERRPFVKSALLITLAAVSSHGVIILLVCCALMLVFHLLKNRAGLTNLLALIKPLALLAAATLVLNLFWIAPTIMLFGSTYAPSSPESYIMDFKLLAMDLPPEASIATMHGFWRYGFIYTKDVFQYWYVPFILIAALACAGLIALLRAKPHHALFLFAVFIIGFLLALGNGGPLSSAFTLFGKELPIYMIFRDSHKFIGMICLAYSMLGSYGANHVLRSLQRRKLAALAVILLLPLIYNFGFFNFLGQIGTTQYPADWVEAGRIISADPSETSILVLPPYLYSTYSWSNATQKTLPTPAAHFFSKPVIISQGIMMPHIYSDIKDVRGDYRAYIFKKRQYINNTAELLAPLNARYIIVLKEYEDADSYLWLFKRRGGVDNITLVYEGDSLYLFRNELVTGPLLASADAGEGGFQQLANVSIDGLSQNVSYIHINPVTYLITGCGAPYLFYATSAGPFMEFNGNRPEPWHAIASTFRFSGPGILSNGVFPVSLALFILAWLLTIALLIHPQKTGAVLLAASAVPLYILAWGDILGPHALGTLLAISLASAGIMFNHGYPKKASKSFLNIKCG
ncbi:hypothetical protein H0O00_02785 [Candidatus Micrarchaeota archaeon]|nr:hypothetical protein [Candidatus Micrarchaeota archaeon]